VSLLGRPNAGKSTLLNSLVGEKVAIAAPKPQTTRLSLQGIVNRPGAQIVFVDTPGIHTPRNLLNERMMESVRAALRDQDVLVWLADATLPFEQSSEGIALLGAPGEGENAPAPALAVLNKLDRLRDKRALLPLMEAYGRTGRFDTVVPASALTGEGVETLVEEILRRLQDGPQYFPPDQVTNAPDRFLAAEIVREKILHTTEEEVPHSVAVLVEKWEELPRLLRIAATIHVEREGQKKILIGAGGAALKRVGTQARAELESRHGKQVFLELFVKVKPKWRESPAFLNELDWRV
jgi:GTP-binding protein Era